MRIPKPTAPPQIVEVEWLDAALIEDGKEEELATMRTCGYYHLATDELVSLAGDYDPETKECRTKTVIPRVHVRRFTVLRPRKGA